MPAPPADDVSKDNGWLHLVFPRRLSTQSLALIPVAEEMKTKLTADLGAPVLAHVEVRVAGTPEEMAALAPIGNPPPSYASGVAYRGLGLVLLTLQAPGSYEVVDLPETLRHELAHVALDDIVGDQHVPRWFNEGLAVHESGESAMARAKALWEASLADTLLPFSQLDRGFPEERQEVTLAYAESADFVRFLLRDADRTRFVSLLQRVKTGTPFDVAVGDAYSSDLRRLEYEWREEVGKRYSVLPVLTGGTILWVGIIALMGVGYVRRRRAAKAKLLQWEREEREMDELAAAAKARARAAALVENDVPVMVELPKPVAALPMVEHDGRWHTLH